METEEIFIICNKCGCEFPLEISMPNPETGRGDYCFECFIDLEHKWNVRTGTAWLTHHLPSLTEFMKEYKSIAKGSLDPRRMENNCHSAAHTLVKLVKGKMDIELQRGHWTGIDVRDKTQPFQQHSWTKVKIPNNPIEFIVDPTQWVFTGKEPSLCISTEDDARYDVGGYHTKSSLFGEETLPKRKGQLKKSNLSKDAKKWLSSKSKRDWSKWTVEEMFTIANMDPRSMMGHAKEIFQSIIKCGHKAFIPVDGLTMANCQ